MACRALTAQPPIAFRIVGDSRTGTQYLPTPYALRFARWQVDRRTNQLVRFKDHPENKSSTLIQKIRPTVDFVVKGGVPSYFMAGLQRMSSSLENNTVPTYSSVISQQWLTFDMIIEPNMRLVVFRGDGDGTDERVAFFGPKDIKNALERLGVTLSMECDQLQQGFHILSIPISDDWISVTMKDELKASTCLTVTCMATAEPEPRELLTLDDSLLEMTVTSLLQTSLTNINI